MTSYTKALYRRDPAAAAAFHEQQTFEHKIVHGRTPTLACFTPAYHGLKPSFGKRVGSTITACSVPCEHPACAQGCTRRGGLGQ